MPTLTRYPILRSGFVGLSIAGLITPSTPFDRVSNSILGKSRLAPNNDYFYHEKIDELFKMSIKNYHMFNDLSVQEMIVLSALEAFGSKNFFKWLELQNDKPSVSYAHHTFLIETLDFITGTSRKLHVTQWIGILEARPNAKPTKIMTLDYFKKFDSKTGVLPNKLSSIITMWVGQENGWYDLLSSLMVIFGNRHILSGSADV